MGTTYYIIPDIRSRSEEIKESYGIVFLCPANTVITGRWHSGDENGATRYEYATLKVIDENGNTVQMNIDVTDIQWSDEIKESDGTT